MQAKQEVDEVCVRIFLVAKPDPAKVRRKGRDSVGIRSDIHIKSVGVCVSAQSKNSNQEDSKHKECGQHRPAEPFHFYHAIKFSSFPKGYILIPTPR